MHGDGMGVRKMDYFKIAQVLKPQGIKGEVKLKPFVDHLDRFLSLTHIYLKRGGGYECRAVSGPRIYKQFAYLKIEGIDDRNAAETLRGQSLYIDRAHAAKLPEGAVYIADLIGLAVVTEKGKTLGTLKDVMQTGGVDIYVVETERPFLFAAAPHVVLKKDVQGGRIIVDETRLGEVAVYE